MRKVQSARAPIVVEWYKSRWFLTVLNSIAGVIGIWGLTQVFLLWDPFVFNTNSTVSVFATLIGIMNGGIFGYTLWATAEDFPQPRVVQLSGLWGATIGGIVLTRELFICSMMIFPPIALLISLYIVRSWRHIGSWLSSAVITGIIGAIFLSLTSNPTYQFVMSAILGAIFGWIFVNFLQLDVKRQREERARQDAMLERQQQIAMGMHMDGTYTVGDDGELIQLPEEGNDNTNQQS